MVKVFSCSQMYSVFHEENHEFSKQLLSPLNLYSGITVKYRRIRTKRLCFILGQANQTRIQEKYKLVYQQCYLYQHLSAIPNKIHVSYLLTYVLQSRYTIGSPIASVLHNYFQYMWWQIFAYDKGIMICELFSASLAMQ